MNSKIILSLLISISLLAGCNSNPSYQSNLPTNPQTQPTNSTNQNPDSSISISGDNVEIASDTTQFSLSINEAVKFPANGLTIEFVDVKSDSRCPPTANCVWAGQAVVHIKTSGATNTDADLIINGTNSLTIGGNGGINYVLKIIDLTPRPLSAGAAIDKKQYKATFQLDVVK